MSKNIYELLDIGDSGDEAPTKNENVKKEGKKFNHNNI